MMYALCFLAGVKAGILFLGWLDDEEHPLLR